MNSSKKYSRILASVMAFSIVTSAVASSETNIIKSIIPINTITADASYHSGYWDYEILSDGTAKLVKYYGSASSISIPKSIGNYSVTLLGDCLFQNNTNLKSVTVPSSVKEISSCCFDGASKLEYVNLPNGLTKICNCAFRGTTNLKSINIPSTVNTLCYRAFCNSGLTSITLQYTSSIETNVFEGCGSLKRVTLPKNLNRIFGSTFKDCTSLESISIPTSVTHICRRAFENCSSLSSVIIPSSVTFIGEEAFKKCSSLKSITIPSSVKEFDDMIFDGCTSLGNINIASSSVFKDLITAHSLKGTTKLSKINNEPIVYYKSKGSSGVSEPYFNSKYSSIIYEYFDTIDSDAPSFYEEFLRADIKYIVATNTSPDQTDGEKIKALHDWICNKVQYAYVNGKPDPSKKSHGDSSVFMSNTAVCEGYAKALSLLLDEAGVEVYYIAGWNHAWNMVKIGERYFHIDATHDDEDPSNELPNGKINYSHFLKSDKDILTCTSGHKNFNYEHPTPSRIRQNPTTLYKCEYSLGDVTKDGVIDNKDTEFIQRYLLKLEKLSKKDEVLADANLDGHIDMSDVVKLIIDYKIK